MFAAATVQQTTGESRMTDLALPPDPRQHLSSATTRAAMRVQSAVLIAAREFLGVHDFTELLPPIIGPVTDPGVRGSKQVDVDYYGHRYKLMTSVILYKQASLLAFDKVYCVAPNVRLEPLQTVDTGRHLAEFHQIDVEVAGAGYQDAMDLAERLFRHVVQRVLDVCSQDLASVRRDVLALKRLPEAPFSRIPHAVAVERLRAAGHPQSADAEVDWVGERHLSDSAERPFFITGYPKGSRGFYDRESRTTPGTLCNFDLLAPEGYGELASGGEREASHPVVVERMRETGENPAKYGWYLDLMRGGVPGSAGFGLGLERLTRYLCGLPYVWQASAYPKVPGRVSP
jgi:asparaginyl-tRNA synthetase